MPRLGRCCSRWSRRTLGLSESRYSSVGSAFASSPAKRPRLGFVEKLDASASLVAPGCEDEFSSLRYGEVLKLRDSGAELRVAISFEAVCNGHRHAEGAGNREGPTPLLLRIEAASWWARLAHVRATIVAPPRLSGSRSRLSRCKLKVEERLMWYRLKSLLTLTSNSSQDEKEKRTSFLVSLFVTQNSTFSFFDGVFQAPSPESHHRFMIY